MNRKKLLIVVVVVLVLAAFLVLLQGTLSKNRPKALLVGLDGAEWSVINQLSEEGKLPNLKMLIDEGVSGNLRSITPILSPIVWTSIATGKTQEKHGITWFMVRDADGKEGMPVTSTMRNTKAIWNILSANKKKVGMIGWWASWPAEKVNGFVISDHIAYHGFGLTSEKVKTEVGLTYPPELTGEIGTLQHVPQKMAKSEIDRFMNITEEEYNIGIHSEFTFNNPLHHFMYALANSRTYLGIYRMLKSEYDVDLMGVYFEGIDTVGHLFMKFRPPKMEGMPDQYFEKFKDVMDNYYMYQDEIIGEILQDAGPNTTVIICSDHGFKTGADRLKEFYNTDVRNAAKWHTLNGVIIMKGPGIRRNAKIEGASVLDITPTILHILGLPTAKDFDGKVLTDAFTPEYLKKNEISYVMTYETGRTEEGVTVAQTEIDGAIRDRLESLGYLGGGSSDSAVVADEIYLNRASALISKRQFDDAIKELEKIFAKKPDDLKALLSLGQIYYAQRKYEDSVETSNRIISANEQGERMRPGLLGQAFASKALALLALKRNDEALEHFKKSLDVYPQNPEVRYNLAILYQQEERYEEAISEYEATIVLDPANSFAHNNLGNIFKSLNQQEKAKSLFAKAVEINPNNAEALFNLGVCYMEEGKYDEAALEFEKALFLRNRFPQAKINLAFAHLKAGEYGKAKNIFGNFLSQYRNSPLGWYGMALVEERLGNQDKSVTLLKRALLLNKEIVLERIEEEGEFKDVDVAALAGK